MKEHRISLDGLSVCIGIPALLPIHAITVKSLFATQGLCIKVGVQCDLAIIAESAVVQWARDEVLHAFLETDSNRLFMIDSDMIWEAEDFMRLLALSQYRKVVCASYRAKKDQPTYYIRYDESKPLKFDDYGLLEIFGIGLGFTVVHREVIEKLVEKAPKIYDEITDKTLASVFDVGSVYGKRRGEDMDFFEKVRNLGYKVYLDPSIELGHKGTKVYRGKALDAMNMIDG